MNYYDRYRVNNYNDNRFIVPFLLGGLAGGAAVEECSFVKKYK